MLLENVGWLLNLDHLETAKVNFKKIGWPRSEKSKLEKGWFGSKQDNSTLRVGKKHGVAVTWPFLGVEQAIIPHLKEGYLDYLLIQNF